MFEYQNDFDNAVNAEWKAENPIPDIYPRYTNFTKLSEELEALKIAMCKDEKNTFIHKIFQLFMNQQEEDTLRYIKNKKINPIMATETKTELIDYLINEITNGNYTFFHICHSGTERNPTFQIPHFSFSGISLPDQSYYTDREELRDDFLNMIKMQMQLFSIEQDCDFIWDLEKTIASFHYTRAEKREPLKTYHPTTMYFVKEKMTPYFDSMSTLLPEEYHDIVLNNHQILDAYKKIIEEYSLDQLKIWFVWQVVDSLASYTTGQLYMNHFAFFNTKLNGIKQPKSLEKRGAGYAESYLSDIFTKMYLDNHVDKDLKNNFKGFVEEIRGTLLKKLEKASWMCDETRKKALDKLVSMELKVVGPTHIESYDALKKQDFCGQFLAFIDAYYKWDWDILEVKKKMYAMRDPKEWLMSAMTINAYYHPLYNEIVFPAGILQAPFYSSDQTRGENLGGIGAVIAHEMTHGFDDQGSRFDKNGYLRNWWSKETRERFEDIIKNMETHFNNLTYKDKPVNGKLTQGENLADLGGLQISLATCKDDAEKRECMLSWGKIWRANVRKEYAQQMLVVDPHSPPRLRINGILQHIGDFYRIFDVKEEHTLFLDLDKRCMLWSE